ncbi:unnamed protein product [Phytomonas sp. EM1]|nr:unnamed protein product [Phytomonas sp. EM1]|eukprot:CCW65131.1 unnamed protein product [Phytomonas sp. isolate EM1]
MREVAQHRSEESLWAVIRGVVYDFTEFAKFHVGGPQVLLEHAGTDTTEVFDRFHAWVDCESLLASFKIGIVADGGV